MKEYFGRSAEKYQQTEGKKFLLIPAIRRAIPRARQNGSAFLDVGCGNGDYFPIAKRKGYTYYGVDLSPDMIARARQDYPLGNYLIAPSTNFARRLTCSFDVVLMSMLLPVFRKKADILRTLREAKTVLAPGGTLIIGIAHPCFDPCMAKALVGKPNVTTRFKGYFASGTPFTIHKRYERGVMVFHDFHWTLADYLSVIKNAGLQLDHIDECRPVGGGREYLKQKSVYPTFLVMVCRAKE